MASSFAKVVYGIGRIPVVGGLLRRAARAYRDGSVVTIPAGQAAGLRWVRHHRYVSGYHLGIYEPKIQQALARELRPGQTFYDVGANAGFFTLIGSRLVGPEGKVFSFEPLPENADTIEEQLLVNGVGNVRVVRSAVADQQGVARLVLTGNTSTPYVAHEADTNSAIRVSVLSLDCFAREHAPPDLVKIDVEGAEARVLEGSRGLIAQRRTAFLVEIHGDQTVRHVARYLAGAGYRLSDIAGRIVEETDRIHHLFACHPDSRCES